MKNSVGYKRKNMDGKTNDSLILQSDEMLGSNKKVSWIGYATSLK